MKNIVGSRQIPHPKEVVFNEGLNSHHWVYDNGLFRIEPQADRMGLGEKVDVSINLENIKTIRFSAVVAKCVENSFVAVRGKHALGQFGLSITLLNGNEDNTTSAGFELGIGLSRLAGIARPLINKHLDNEVDPYIDRLSSSITTTIHATNTAQP